MSADLTVSERQERERLEAVIDAGLQSFLEVGNALQEIRDRRLYRSTHKTFDDYCRERWGIAKNTANQYISAASIVSNLTAVAVKLPDNEYQTRPLKQLQPDQQREAWALAVETAPDGKITHNHVQRIVKQVKGELKVCAKDPSHTWIADVDYCPYCRHDADERIERTRREREREREKRRQQNYAKVSSGEPIEKLSGVFSTILIDPPWSWGDEGDQDQFGRARPTYNTMTYDELLALPVGKYADDNSHVYLWITNRSLPKGFGLLDAWGFRYITCITWVKPHFGMGNYFRGQTEHLLFGVRGSLSLKRRDAPTVFHADRGPGGHSSKPPDVYDLIESCSPGPYLELFGRTTRDGWVCWGEDGINGL